MREFAYLAAVAASLGIHLPDYEPRLPDRAFKPAAESEKSLAAAEAKRERKAAKLRRTYEDTE